MVTASCRVALLLALAFLAEPASHPRITIISGTRPDGSATELWLTILRRRLTPQVHDSVARIRRLPTRDEESWARRIQARAAFWPAAADSLLGLFDVPSPPAIRVVLGNRGGEDAFTHDSLTIGFDLSALQRVYGDASAGDNAGRLDRFFRHEFAHLLQKRWLARHPFVPRTPIEAALLDAWAEGLGNYFSLSQRWQPSAGAPSPQTRRALAELEPRFVSRMTALACADSTAARPLLADLSAGPFTRKWGALPVALWLLADLSTDSAALRSLAQGGPTAVWALAQRHLPPGLGDSLMAIRERVERGASCGS